MICRQLFEILVNNSISNESQIPRECSKEKEENSDYRETQPQNAVIERLCGTSEDSNSEHKIFMEVTL